MFYVWKHIVQFKLFNVFAANSINNLFITIKTLYFCCASHHSITNWIVTISTEYLGLRKEWFKNAKPHQSPPSKGQETNMKHHWCPQYHRILHYVMPWMLIWMDMEEEIFASPIVSTMFQDVIIKGVSSTFISPNDHMFPSLVLMG